MAWEEISGSLKLKRAFEPELMALLAFCAHWSEYLGAGPQSIGIYWYLLSKSLGEDSQL